MTHSSDAASRPLVHALVLAAGAGTRFGGPKALARTADGTPWVERVVSALRGGGCDAVTVVLGARADAARGLVPANVSVVIADRWQDGLSASVRVGLEAVAETDAAACMICPVDVPGLPAAVVERVLAAGVGSHSLSRATYRGDPGHPVLVGRDHFMPISASISGDVGAGQYLRAHGAREIPCDDLWDGADHDAS